jgi:hypothetical protein
LDAKRANYFQGLIGVLRWREDATPVKQEVEAESRKTPKVSSEEEIGGNAPVPDAVAALLIENSW